MDSNAKPGIQDKLMPLFKAAILLILCLLLAVQLLQGDGQLPFEDIASVAVRLFAFLFVLYIYRRWRHPQVLPIALLFLMMALYQTHWALLRDGRIKSHEHLLEPLSVLVTVLVVVSCYYLWSVFRQQDKERAALTEEAHELSDKLKKLENILPMCQYCKRVRLGDGDPLKQASWSDVEAYFKTEEQPQLSHGICPECAKKHHPDYFNKHFE